MSSAGKVVHAQATLERASEICREAAQVAGWKVSQQPTGSASIARLVGKEPWTFSTHNAAKATFEIRYMGANRCEIRVSTSNLGLGPIQNAYVTKRLETLVNALEMQIFLENSEAMPDSIQGGQKGSQTVKYCSNCGSEVKDAAKFCSECGAELGGAASAQQSRPPVMETCQITISEKDTFGGMGAHCILEAVALGPYGRRVFKKVEFGASRYPGEWPRDRRVASQLNAMVAELVREGWEPTGSTTHPYFGVNCPAFRRQYKQH